jgi:2'-hydroxyisoflavone reductase
MRLLLLGGTSWLGGAVATSAVARGHEVTCLARGASGTVPPGATLVPADRWQPGAYDGLPDFDAAIEVSWQPELVRSAVEAVRADHWVYVSSISVYAEDDARVPHVNMGNLLPAWQGTGQATPEVYGEAKVACEVAYAASPSVMIARAGLIGGYGDKSDRVGYWPARIDAARADRQSVLVPPATTPVQVIDVLDLAEWLVHCAVSRVTGVFDAVGQQSTFQQVVEASVQAAGTSPTYVEASSAQLEAAGVRPWSGADSLPLWAPELAGQMRRSSAAAEAAGLRLRPLTQTVADALRWERELGIDRARVSGLSPERESDVIKLL